MKKGVNSERREGRGGEGRRREGRRGEEGRGRRRGKKAMFIIFVFNYHQSQLSSNMDSKRDRASGRKLLSSEQQDLHPGEGV